MNKVKNIFILFIFVLLLVSCKNNSIEEKDYGVFLGASSKDIDYMQKYSTIVIDAQYYTKDEISKIKENNKTVYSYINIGAIEDFRDYYNDYLDITLGDYENWEEERWVDVSNINWQSFILNELSVNILNKGVDGLFIDNVDVYYNYEETKIYDGLVTILKELNERTYISINGGDTFVYKYYEMNNNITDIMDAVNQETVFSKINWNKKDSFSKNNASDLKYFKDYVEFVFENGCDVYLLEYTKDNKLIREIDAYCKQKGFKYYASKTLELLAK